MEIPFVMKSLKSLVGVLLDRISVLESKILDLSSENNTLRDKLNLNSKNSNNLSSSDGLSKKPTFPKANGL